MSKFCFKTSNGTVKYDLKDSANNPKLAIRVGNVTKYLSLKQGTKSGELHVRNGSNIYYVQTWDINDPANWNIIPYKGTIGSGAGNTDFGGCALWVLRYNGRIACIIGMISADKPDDWAKAEWDAVKDATCSLDYYDCGTPCIRLATHPFGIGASSGYYHASASSIYGYLTDTSMLQDVAVSGKGFSITKHIGWGAAYLDTKYSSLPSAKRISSIVATNAPYSSRQHYFRIDCTNTSKIQMLGESDDDPYAVGKWATRCFMVEYPEVINTGKTPREILNIWKTIMTDASAYNTDYGTCYGRNYGTAQLLQPQQADTRIASFMFGIPHSGDGWGKAFTLQDSPVVTSPYYLGWAEESNSNGGEVYNTKQYIESQHEYMYLASDNTGSAPNCESGFIDVQGHTGWYRVFSHRHGRTIWIDSIDINGEQQPPNVDRRIHVGDRIAVHFVINRDYGNESDNYGAWSYWCRPALRQLDTIYH